MYKPTCLANLWWVYNSHPKRNKKKGTNLLIAWQFVLPFSLMVYTFGKCYTHMYTRSIAHIALLPSFDLACYISNRSPIAKHNGRTRSGRVWHATVQPGDITRESHDSLETAAKKLRRLLRRHYDDIILPCQSFECNPISPPPPPAACSFLLFLLLLTGFSSIAFYNPSLLLCCLRRHILLYRIWLS